MTHYCFHGTQVEFDNNGKRMVRRTLRPTSFTSFLHEVKRLCAVNQHDLQGHTLTLQAWDGQAPHDSGTLAHTTRMCPLACVPLHVFPCM